MISPYKQAIKNKTSAIEERFMFIFFPIISIVLILLGYYFSNYWHILSVISVLFNLYMFYDLIVNINKEYKYLKTKEQYLPDGTHIISSGSFMSTNNIEITLKNGKRDGNCKVYKEDNGQEIIIENRSYSNGVLHGEQQYFYNNGQLHYKVYFDEGEQIYPDGNDEVFFSNGKIKSSAKWENGQQNGPSLTYLKSGELIRKSQIKNGEFYGDTKEFYENGNTRMVKRGNTYIFFNKNELKVCEINIDISSVKRVDYNGKSSERGEPKAEGFNIEEKWTQFHENGIDIDYQIQIDTNSNKALLFEKYVNGTPTITKEVQYVFKKYFFLGFESSFIDERLRPKQKIKFKGDRMSGNWENVEGAHKYFLGFNLGNIKGPPGIGNTEIDIKPVNSLRDLISLEST